MRTGEITRITAWWPAISSRLKKFSNIREWLSTAWAYREGTSFRLAHCVCTAAFIRRAYLEELTFLFQGVRIKTPESSISIGIAIIANEQLFITIKPAMTMRCVFS